MTGLYKHNKGDNTMNDEAKLIIQQLSERIDLLEKQMFQLQMSKSRNNGKPYVRDPKVLAAHRLVKSKTIH